MVMTISTKCDLTIGIPCGRDVNSVLEILRSLNSIDLYIEVLVARWQKYPFSNSEIALLNQYFNVKQVLSKSKHASCRRNTILNFTSSEHILFLDDDVVPDPNLLQSAIELINSNPSDVYQGPPYLVANPDSWIARIEGKFYERTFERHITPQGETALLDARLLLAPVSILLQNPFDESLVFAGEGEDLAQRLQSQGVRLRFAPTLIGYHKNRESICPLLQQKRCYGNGRGQVLRKKSMKNTEYWHYLYLMFMRHFIKPGINFLIGKETALEAFYTIATNLVFWIGIFEEFLTKRSEYYLSFNNNKEKLFY